MSTLKVTQIQHPSSPTPAIILDSTGAMTGSFSYPNRNLIYNGAMQIHQRSASVANITGTGYNTADRWITGNDTLGTWTQTVENDAPTGSGFRKSFKMLCTTADAAPSAADFLQICQGFEGQDLQRIAKGTSAAQQLTVSFWVKANVTGTYIVYLYDHDNARQVCASYTITANATWERKIITFPADTIGVLDNDNAMSLQICFVLASGSNRSSGTLQTTWASWVAANNAAGQVNLASTVNNYWQITGVQLETGSVATPFEFKSFGQDLRECQRYYWRQNAGSLYSNFGIVRAESATAANAFIVRPITMRTQPTVVEYLNLGVHDPGDSIRAVSALTAAEGNESFSYLVITAATGMTAGVMYWLSANNSTSAYLALGAEL